MSDTIPITPPPEPAPAPQDSAIVRALAELSKGTLHIGKAAIPTSAIIGLVAVVYWGFSSGWVNTLATNLAPKPAEIKAVHATLPQMGRLIVGDSYVYTLENIEGPAGDIAFTAFPGTLVVTPMGRGKVTIKAEEAGPHELFVSISGDKGQLFTASTKLEAVDLTVIEEPDPAAPPAPAPMPAAHVPTVAEQTLAALANVQSDRKAEDVQEVHQAAVSVLHQLQSGLLGEDTDVIAAWQNQLRSEIGVDRARPWDVSFFTALATIYAGKLNSGEVKTGADGQELLKDMAAALEAAH